MLTNNDIAVIKERCEYVINGWRLYEPARDDDLATVFNKDIPALLDALSEAKNRLQGEIYISDKRMENAALWYNKAQELETKIEELTAQMEAVEAERDKLQNDLELCKDLNELSIARRGVAEIERDKLLDERNRAWEERDSYKKMNFELMHENDGLIEELQTCKRIAAAPDIDVDKIVEEREQYKKRAECAESEIKHLADYAEAADKWQARAEILEFAMKNSCAGCECCAVKTLKPGTRTLDDSFGETAVGFNLFFGAVEVVGNVHDDNIRLLGKED